jgi:hypothetical protein
MRRFALKAWLALAALLVALLVAGVDRSIRVPVASAMGFFGGLYLGLTWLTWRYKARRA